MAEVGLEREKVTEALRARGSVRRRWWCGECSPRAAFWVVWVLVAVSGVLKAVRLDFPAALTDEAFTYWRICGSFSELMQALRPDAFVPLHYELLWVLTKVLGQELWVMRLPGVVAGLLMPAAVYLVGRSLFGRRAGVYGAVLAAVNAYFAWFARDAKMYMPAWCLMTASVGYMLIYARTGRRLPWLLAVLMGVGAGGTHAVTFIMLALMPVMTAIWARRRVWRRTALSVLALGVIAAGPVIYYSTFNRWFTDAGGLSRTKEDGTRAEHDNGLMWIEGWQSGRTPGNVLVSSLMSYAFAYEWPEDEDRRTEPDVTQPLSDWNVAETMYVARRAGWAVLGVLALGVAGCVARGLAGGVPGWRRRDVGRWVAIGSVGVVAVMYLFYLRSFAELAAPWQAPVWAIVAAVVVSVVAAVVARRGSALWWCGLSVVLLAATWGAAKGMYAMAPRTPTGEVVWNHLWMPRYSAVVLPMLIVVAGALVACIPTKVMRWSGAGLLVGLGVVAAGLRVVVPTEFPSDVYSRDVVLAWPADGSRETVVCTPDGALGATVWRRRLPGPYASLAMAAKLDATPNTFREGNQWPYRPGTAVLELMRRYRAVPARSVVAEAERVKPRRIILWQVDLREADSAVVRALKAKGWKVTDLKQWQIRHVWTWTKLEYVQRFELRREGEGGATTRR